MSANLDARSAGPSTHAGQRSARRAWWSPAFEVKLALLLTLLSLLYAVTFSKLVYVSLLDLISASGVLLPRYAGPVHQHNAIEWVLLVGPAGIGWLGAVGNLLYLVRRWLDGRR